MDETDLRRRLHGLPRDIEPSRDLWPGIAARLPPRAARAPRRSRRPWFAGMAIAACLCVAVGVAYTLRPAVSVDHGPAPVTAAAPDDARHDLLVREADAMTLEYEAALRQFEGAAMPAALRPALATLDRSALEIRGALADDPDAVFLLEQLRRTYARRVTLTQRAVTG